MKARDAVAAHFSASNGVVAQIRRFLSGNREDRPPYLVGEAKINFDGYATNTRAEFIAEAMRLADEMAGYSYREEYENLAAARAALLAHLEQKPT